jgi:hypothetical protein
MKTPLEINNHIAVIAEQQVDKQHIRLNSKPKSTSRNIFFLVLPFLYLFGGD